jgi:chondroitin AC lyase
LTHCALGTWLENNKDGGHWFSTNWWYRSIGTELALQGIFVMLGLNRTTPAEQATLTAFSFYSDWWNNDYGGGANLVWMVTAEILRSAVTGNSSGLDQGFNVVWSNVVNGNVSENWQGIVVDNAYHFHGEQLLSSAYGVDWLASILQFWQVAEGTRWSMPTDREAILAAYIAEGNLALSFGGRWDFGTQGRGIDRPGTDFTWGIPTVPIRLLATQPGIEQWSAGLVAFADGVDGTPQVPAPSNKYFHTSDFHVHHRPTWGAALKMFGNNTFWSIIPNEDDNSENIVGQNTGSGVLNVYPAVDYNVAASAYESIFPLLDWNAINGITVEHSTPINPASWSVTYTNFVGGVSDGLFGASAMDTKTHNTSAQRSFFFFDDAIVAVATNLTNGYGTPRAPQPADVWTTLASRLVPSAASDPVLGTLTVAFANGTVSSTIPDGAYTFPGGQVDWFAVGGVGIWPALSGTGVQSTSASLGLTLRETTGNWNSIGPYSGQVTGRMLTAALDHGTQLPPGNPSSANGYAYMIAPNVTAADMKALNATSAGVACVVASPTVHGASQPSAGITSVVFWADYGGEYDCAETGMSVSVSTSALVVVSVDPANKTASVTVSHPYRLGGSIMVSAIVSATGAGCAPDSQPGATVFTVPFPTTSDMTGSSNTVTCQTA